MTEETKKCPYCAETIKAEAVVCRYCRRDLLASNYDSVSQTASPRAPISKTDIAEARKGNAILVWPAILLIIIVCPLLMLIHQIPLGIIAAIIGIGLLIYAIITGRLKFFG